MPKLYTAEIVVPVSSPPVRNGAVLVRGDRIVAVGPSQRLKRDNPDATPVDFGRAILMPPLVNAHTHLELTDFPLWSATGQSSGAAGFVDWILQLIQVKHSVEMQQVEKSIEHGLDALLRCGTGAVCDILSIAAFDACYRKSPLRGWLCYELIGLDDGMGPVLPTMAADWLQTEPLPTLRRGLSPHAPYTVGGRSLARIGELAARQKILLTMHAAESPDETAFLHESKGALAETLYPAVGWRAPEPPLAQGPLAFIDSAGILSPSTLLVHGVQFSEEEIRRIARARVSVVLCPRSNTRLGAGRAPLESYLCQGVNLALGTDSMASNESLSLWDEMEFARELFSPVLAPEMIVAMATVNGARALRIDDDLGGLSAGREASFLVLSPARLPAVENVADFLCRSERRDDVRHLYLADTDVLA